MPPAQPLAPSFSFRAKPIVQPCHQISGDEADDEAITEPDQAADKTDAVADKVLTQQGEMRADGPAAFDDEPVRREEDGAAQQEPGNEALYGRVETGQTGQDDIRAAVVWTVHRTLSGLSSNRADAVAATDGIPRTGRGTESRSAAPRTATRRQTRRGTHRRGPKGSPRG